MVFVRMIRLWLVRRTIEDFDLSPDGAGLSGRSNQVNDIVFVQVTAASLAAAGYTLNEIYELVSGNEGPGSNQWRDFVRDLEVEVVDDTTTGNAYNEIRLVLTKMEMVRQPILGRFPFWRQVLVRVITMR